MQTDRTPTVIHQLEQREWHALRAELETWPAPEIVDLLRDLAPPDRPLVFRLLPRQLASKVFALMSSSDQNALLNELSNDETRQLLAEMSPDARTELFEELAGEVTQRLMNLLSPEDLREARQLLGYPVESVGRLMTPDYVAVRPEWTVERALAHTRRVGQSSETITVLYVVDDSWKLLDAVDIRDVILAASDSRVESLMDDTFVALSAFDDREEAVRKMERYDLSVLPVVDSSGVLVGIVTFDDVLDVATEEATEDFHLTGGVAPLRRSYRDIGFGMLYRKRVGWLVILVFMNVFSGAIIASFEETIAAAVALVFFLPLLIDSGGNAGSQSATLMVRALATGDIEAGDWLRIVGRELAVAAALGITMGIAVSWLGVFRGGPEVGLIVAITMVAVVIVGSLAGTVLPFILNRLGWDPATASAPLIATFCDISGVIIYFSLATWLLDIG